MKEMVIVPPEGYEVDKENSTFEKVVFKQIDRKPKTFEQLKTIAGFYITSCSTLYKVHEAHILPDNHNIWPTRELAEASLALCQLTQLRKAWVGNWEPDWKSRDFKACIVVCSENIKTNIFWVSYSLLSFPTQEMAEEFHIIFKDLLEVAKPLI